MFHLGRFLGFGGLLAVILAMTPGDVAAQKKKKNAGNTNTADPATDADYKQIQKVKNLVGTVISASGTTMTLKVDYPHFEQNPKYRPPKNVNNNQQAQMMRTYQDLMRQQQIAMSTTNPQARARALQRYNQDLMRFQQQYAQQYNRMVQQYQKALQQSAKNKNNKNNTTDPYIIVTTSKEFELDMQDKVVVRKNYLPLEFDDTGKPKVYSEKEKAKLRGDDKTKPGYSATMDEVLPGTEVKLYLTPPPKKEKSKADPKSTDEPVATVDRPTINMVLLTKESSASSITGDDGKGRKKKKN